MKFYEMSICVSKMGEELVSNLLFEKGAQGVFVEDKGEIVKFLAKGENFDYVDDTFLKKMKDQIVLKFFIEKDEFETQIRIFTHALEELKENAKGNVELGSLELTQREVDDIDWVNLWKEHYQPIEMERIIICPKWQTLKSHKEIVFLEPGMAFGTGSHETTSMCISLLEELDLKGKQVADIGTGSGILGICASKLGAKYVYMCDIDQMAVEVARENAQFNHTQNATIEKSNLADGISFTPDIVVSNITYDILISMAETLFKIAGKTPLILSGILKEKLQIVIDAFVLLGYEVDKTLTKGEWSAVRFK